MQTTTDANACANGACTSHVADGPHCCAHCGLPVYCGAACAARGAADGGGDHGHWLCALYVGVARKRGRREAEMDTDDYDGNDVSGPPPPVRRARIGPVPEPVGGPPGPGGMKRRRAVSDDDDAMEMSGGESPRRPAIPLGPAPIDFGSEVWLALPASQRLARLGDLWPDELARLYHAPGRGPGGRSAVAVVLDVAHHRRVLLHTSTQLAPTLRALLVHTGATLRDLFDDWAQPLPAYRGASASWFAAYLFLATLQPEGGPAALPYVSTRVQAVLAAQAGPQSALVRLLEAGGMLPPGSGAAPLPNVPTYVPRAATRQPPSTYLPEADRTHPLRAVGIGYERRARWRLLLWCSPAVYRALQVECVYAGVELPDLLEGGDWVRPVRDLVRTLGAAFVIVTSEFRPRIMAASPYVSLSTQLLVRERAGPRSVLWRTLTNAGLL